MSDTKQLEEIREKIGDTDMRIIDALADRMVLIQDIIAYKKATGIPILQPEQEAKQTKALEEYLKDNEFEEECICALATPAGGAIGIIRLTVSHAKRFNTKLCSFRNFCEYADALASAFCYLFWRCLPSQS